METLGREIKLRRALILGNFYNQQVRIIQAINDSYETIIDTIIGVKPDCVITKDGRCIQKTEIKNIYQMT